MEHKHSFDLVLRAKVLAAEATPVTWNRDRVWNNIAIEEKTSSRKYILLAAAACVAFVLIPSLVITYQSQRDRQLNSKISQLESTLRKRIDEEKLKVVTPFPEDETVCPETRVAMMVTPPPAKRSGEGIAAPKNENVTEQPDPVTPEKDIQEFVVADPVESAEPPTVLQKENRIVAIIGVISNASPIRMHARIKKIKIRINLNDEKSSVAAATDDTNSLTRNLN